MESGTSFFEVIAGSSWEIVVVEKGFDTLS